MGNSSLPDSERYIKKRRFKKRWQKVVTVLGSAVVFCTTYALILPAITMEKTCPLPEHVHDDSCYTQVLSAVKRNPICTAQTLEIHRHEEGCLDGDGEPVCQYADFVVHQHDAACYDENGGLWCPLPEIKVHTHEDSCYAQAESHTHGEDCYVQERGELICEAHEHTPDCWTGTTVRICGLEEAAGHQHTEDCLDENGEVICGLEESDGHEHSSDCYQVIQELTCGVESDHVHTEECFAWNTVLACELEETDGSEPEPTLICGKEEIILHRHTDDCLDSDGNLVCGKTQVLEHRHGAACFEDVEIPVDTEMLTCTVPEGDGAHVHGEGCYDEAGELVCQTEENPGHQHSQRCYGTWELTCGLEEHTHTAECQPGETEPTEEIVYTCGKEEHTHGEECRDEDGNLICEKEEHTHSEACTQELPHYYCGAEEHTHDRTCYDAEGVLICTLLEHTHDELCQVELTEEQLAEIEQGFRSEVDALEAAEELDEDAAEALLKRLEEAYRIGRLSDEAYLELYSRMRVILGLDIDCESIAEPSVGDNWILLRDSGWFQEYSGAGYAANYSEESPMLYSVQAEGDGGKPSSAQIDKSGGTNGNDDDGVLVSKTITGTDIENVFDITLTVQTPQVIDEVIQEPDMAVVIVMDISNTMNSKFGSSTRYKAAMEAAEEFLDHFADNNTLGISKVGYVAFNTDAHQIFGLQPCTNQSQADALKNTMRTQTGYIINPDDYGTTHNRFTNIEAGLKMASDMLSGASNKNKYIIFLSDGFPTTYVSGGYSGYDPYTGSGTVGRDGVFHDDVRGVYCHYGTSYSDKAAIRARQMAASIKASGATIFSIGVDVSGQTIQAYVDQTEGKYFSVVDRTSTSYEIGDASSSEAYRNWLRNSIGSGYYYDSTNTAGLKDAYNQIFETIKKTIETASDADWVANDPIPAIAHDEIEFVGMYNKDGELQRFLSGLHEANEENTASYGEDSTITWDLKNSGYTSWASGNTTTYTYTLRYRVRLKNEDTAFVERKVYDTNGKTTLQYRVVKRENNTTSISEPRFIDFPIPSVHGFLANLTFKKMDNRGNFLSDAEFTLSHDAKCSVCNGNDGQVKLTDFVEVSDSGGSVSFANIPSGHSYTLKETRIPPGYSTDGRTYTVTVAYDVLTVEIKDSAGKPLDGAAWDGKIVNNGYYELPATGGVGESPYIAGGLVLIFGAVFLLWYVHRRRKEEHPSF